MLLYIAAGLLAFVVAVALHDLFQKKRPILRAFPVVGHFRSLLAAAGPKLRQYIVADNDEERPFSRDHRSWIYKSAERKNNYFGFGTDNKIELEPNYLIIRHSAFPLPFQHKGEAEGSDRYSIACAKVMGEWRKREKAFRPTSVVNISAMSYGSLSGPAIRALNMGAKLCGAIHNTGEGGISPYHRSGGDLTWQIGTGYFGCRAPDGGFSMERFLATIEANPTVRAVEIKLSQGAKPGLGGVLPAAKITEEIAGIRGIPMGKDCISPSSHSAFRDPSEMLDFVEELAEATGLPVGIKSAVGDLAFWRRLCELMNGSGRGVDFVNIDGGEGGTGAAPLVFADHVALPFKQGFAQVYRIFREHDLTDKVVFMGAGRLGMPAQALLAFGLGCDMINLGRESMMAIGCIQAQKCHTDHCPTGVATQNAWLTRAIVPSLKSEQLANYFTTLRKEILELCHACGVNHPSLITLEQFDILDDRFGARPAWEVFGYEPDWGRPGKHDREVARLIRTEPET